MYMAKDIFETAKATEQTRQHYREWAQGPSMAAWSLRSQRQGVRGMGGREHAK